MKILAAIDFSSVTDDILVQTQILAQALSAEVTLVHVADPDPEFVGYDAGPKSVRHDVAKEFREEHAKIQDLSNDLRNNGLDATALLIQGNTVEAIQEEAIRLDAEMIIVGSHGHGAVYHLLLGSVSEGVIKNAPCPVLVVPTTKD